MRSQVQVLAGPPAIVAGHSAAGSEPGTPAVSLGRAGAARPSPPARPSALSGPSTPASGPTTTTHRGRPPNPRTVSRGRCGHLTWQPASLTTAPPPATSAPRAGLACLAVSGQARLPPPSPNSARVRHQHPLAIARPRQRRPPQASSAVDRTARRRGRPQTSPRSCGHGRPAASTWSPTPPPEVGRDGRVRTDGRTPVGWTPDGWTPNVRTAGMDTRGPDAGRVDTRRPDPRTTILLKSTKVAGYSNRA